MVNGIDIHSSLSEAFQAMGYCPQYDPLWDYLTLREHIESYGAIRGMSKQDATNIANMCVYTPLKL